MIIAIVCKMEVMTLGTFPSLEAAHDIYGEQTELLAFNSQSELDEFTAMVDDIRHTTQALEAAALLAGEFFIGAIQAEA